MTLLAGYYGTLKSFVAQDWAASVACGRPWQGHPGQPRKVLYLAAEGTSGLNQRFTAWESGWNYTILSDSLHVLPVPVNLTHRHAVTELGALVIDGGYQFVVVDTLAKCMVGADENSAQDMGTAVSALYHLQAATNGGTVLAVHHSGKDKTNVRGSSALESGVDSVWHTQGDAQRMTLECMKRKDGRLGRTLVCRFKSIVGTDSGVAENQSVNDQQRGGNAERLLSTFLSSFSETGATRAQLAKASELPSSSFNYALNSLVTSGQLKNVGNDKRQFYRYANDTG